LLDEDARGAVGHQPDTPEDDRVEQVAERLAHDRLVEQRDEARPQPAADHEDDRERDPREQGPAG
jgi:hypothetical protein